VWVYACACSTCVCVCALMCVYARARIYVCECVYRPHESVADRTTVVATAAPEVVPVGVVCVDGDDRDGGDDDGSMNAVITVIK